MSPDSATDQASSDSAPAAAAGEEKTGLIGRLVADRYEVLGELGSGGMSTVYKVKHVHLNRIYAFKVLHETSEEALQRFQQEGRASTLLEHPNIVRVHDFGIWSGRAYMVLDYVEGKPLDEILKDEGPLQPQRAIRMFTQICNALAHAHEQGVVHRDLKPSNMIIRKTDTGVEQAVVLDFGIAKIIKGDVAQNLTRTGDVWGTPLYMSPEQCYGEAIDARADIYSLGCVLYECLTGERPFEGMTTYETIYLQINEAPPPFPKALSKTRIGRGLEAIVLKAMAKSPAKRQKFMLEFSNDLKQIEAGSTGMFADLRSVWRVVSGRMNAIERGKVVERTATQAFTLAAVILTIGLLAIPPLWEIDFREAHRNEAIMQGLDQLLQRRFKEGEILSLDEDDLRRSLLGLEQFCAIDKEEMAIMASLKKDSLSAHKQSTSIPLAFKEMAFSMDGSKVQSLTKALTKTVSRWIEAARYSSELYSLAYGRKMRAMDKVVIYSRLFTICKILGVATELSLLILLARFFVQKKRQAEEAAGRL